MERSAEWPGHSVSVEADTACRGWERTPRRPPGSSSTRAGQQEAHRWVSGPGGAPGSHQGSVGPCFLESEKSMQLFVFLDELDKQGCFLSSSHESQMGDILPGPLGDASLWLVALDRRWGSLLGVGAGLAGALRDPTNKCPSWGCGTLGFSQLASCEDGGDASLALS